MDPERRIEATGGSSKGVKAEDFGGSDAGVVGDKRKCPYNLGDALKTAQANFLAQRNKTHLITHLLDGHKGLAHGLVVGQTGAQVSFQIDVDGPEPSVHLVATGKTNGAHGAQRTSTGAKEAGSGFGNGH